MAVRPLLRNLHDPDKKVRGAAANALMQLGDENAAESLAKALRT